MFNLITFNFILEENTDIYRTTYSPVNDFMMFNLSKNN